VDSLVAARNQAAEDALEADIRVAGRNQPVVGVLDIPDVVDSQQVAGARVADTQEASHSQLVGAAPGVDILLEAGSLEHLLGVAVRPEVVAGHVEDRQAAPAQAVVRAAAASLYLCPTEELAA